MDEPKVTIFDKRDIFKKELKEKLKEIETLCSVYRIPYFMSFCVASEEENTHYENYYLSPGQTGIQLAQNQFRHHVNILNGFYTTPYPTPTYVFTGDNDLDDLQDLKDLHDGV